MKEDLFDYDPANTLLSPSCFAEFITDAFETGNTAFIIRALGVVARAKGMTSIASETGLSLEHLYRLFSEEDDISIQTFLDIMHAVGLKLSAQPQVEE